MQDFTDYTVQRCLKVHETVTDTDAALVPDEKQINPHGVMRFGGKNIPLPLLSLAIQDNAHPYALPLGIKPQFATMMNI